MRYSCRLRGLAVASGLLVLLAACVQPAPPSASLPPQYLGLDSVVHWDKLPYLEYGDRVGSQSTADPGGRNRFTGGLGTLPDSEHVLFAQTGPGVVTFVRMQQRLGGPWRLRQDGSTSVLNADEFGRQAGPYPYPLSLNQPESQGSSILATGLPFIHDLSLTSAGLNGNFYSLYRKLPAGAPLPATNQDSRVAAVLNSSASALLPNGLSEQHGSVSLAGAGTSPMTTIAGSQSVRAISFQVPTAGIAAFANVRLRIYWNGESAPSVDAPIRYLAGDGGTPRELKAFPSDIVPVAGGLRVDLYWPMPFSAGARFELVTGPEASWPIDWSVRYQPFTDPPNWVGTFHANHTDVPHPTNGADMTFLDYRGSGKLVGTVINFGAVGPTLEGDPHIYLDDSRTPQIAGTGTEEWGLGGDYWNRGHLTALPLGGLAANDSTGGAAEYRFLIADSIPFSNHILVNWEHGGVNESTLPYQATMLWYGNASPTAVRTDQQPAPAVADYPLDSAYEYLVTAPRVNGTMTALTAQEPLTLALRPDNVGAFLRRTFDSCVANQRAEVLVDGRSAGIWYDPGHSAGRCWRAEDFPLPASLTSGKSTITVTLKNAPADSAGLPSGTVWTAADYQLYSFVAAR